VHGFCLSFVVEIGPTCIVAIDERFGADRTLRDRGMRARRHDRDAVHDAARRLLDEIGLSTYLFDVERDGEGWTVHVDHPAEGRWRRVVLDASDLPRCLGDRRARRALADRWRAVVFERDAA
jgi:hypothetical protein